MQNDRGWQNIQQMLYIEWGKLAGDAPVSLSARQRDSDARRIKVFEGRCNWCRVPLDNDNRSLTRVSECVDCEQAWERDE